MTLDRMDSEMECKMKKGFEAWTNEGKLSDEKSQQLASMIRKLAKEERKLRWRRPILGIVAVIIFAVLVIVTFPSTRSWAENHLSVAGKYIANWLNWERGWQWAEENEMFQESIASKTDNGYTFRVHRVLADPTQTTVIYTIEGEEPGDFNFLDCSIYFNEKEFNTSMSGRSEIIDGVIAGSIEFNSLPEESGTLQLKLSQIGDIKGSWDVSVPVNRSLLSDMTRTVAVNKTLEMADGLLTVEQLVLAPSQTVVNLRYQGKYEKLQLVSTSDKIKLITPEGDSIDPRGSSSSGSIKGDYWEETYSLEFQRLEEVPSSLTLKLAGLLYMQGETRLEFKGKKSTIAADGRVIYLDKFIENNGKGLVSIRYATDENNPWPYEVRKWQVLDDQGKLHRLHGIKRVEKTNEQSTTLTTEIIETEFEFEWELPQDRKAVALVNSGYWSFQEHLGTITIDIPEGSID